MTPKQLALKVHLRVHPTNASKLVEAHKSVWTARAAEPECLFFDVLQDLADKGKFRFVEVWSMGKEAFEKEHLTKEHNTGLWERSTPVWIEDIRTEYLERFKEGSIFRQAYLDGGKKMDCGSRAHELRQGDPEDRRPPWIALG